jgi:hypothetical protein
MTDSHVTEAGGIERHGWHLFDAVADLYVQQVTEAGEPDLYEVRTGEDGPITVLDAAGFAQLRDPGPNPRGL